MIKTMFTILICLILGVCCLAVIGFAAGCIYGIIRAILKKGKEEKNHEQ